MNPAAVPPVKDLVLVGGGHSHVAVLRRFGMSPLPGAAITVISRDLDTPYSGMLPGFVAGHYTFDEVHIDLGPLARFAGARLLGDEVVGLDLAGRRVLLRQHPPVPYDVLSINTGSTPTLAGVEGAEGRVIPVKPIQGFVRHWQRLRERVAAASGPVRIGIVGAGAGGVELALSIEAALRSARPPAPGAPAPEIHLLAAGPEILPAFCASARRKLARTLARRGIKVHTSARVAAVLEGEVALEGAGRLALDEVVWVTQASAPAWLREAGLATGERGFIQVHATLESVSHPGVFAAGDVADVVRHPREKAGVFAVRQGRPLAENLRRALLGQPPRPFRPQRSFLTILGTGDGRAVASRGSWSAEGAWVWRWKDHIDRRFMARYRDLPPMGSPGTDGSGVRNGCGVPAGLADDAALRELSAAAMRCGGCGAKVGATVLERVLGRLRPRQGSEVLVGLEAPDDAAVVTVPPGLALVQTVDFFRALVDDAYLQGKIAANHSLGDIFAMGARPTTALAIATLPFGLEVRTERVLEDLLRGALEVLEGAGASLVGGHTSEGAELALGFAISGTVDPARALRKSGLRPGDLLVLTKPLGTGTLFAAERRGLARARWIAAAIDVMLQSSSAAAGSLLRHEATAATDVTGFGLLGHLVEMLKASGLDAAIDPAALPALDGALETISRGVFSSLQPQNIRLRRVFQGSRLKDDDPRLGLLFDPQTAGGLLCGIPRHRAAGCLEELKTLGYRDVAVIGIVEPRRGEGVGVRILEGPGERAAAGISP